MQRRTLAAASLIIAFGLAAYSNSFTELFAGLDGKESIRDNPYSRRVWPLAEAMSLPLWEPRIVLDETPAIAHRPSYAFSLALITHLFGLNPRAHHAANVAIHIAAALTLFGIVRRTLARQRFRRISTAECTWLALAAALLWLVHPLQTESVTFIAQRAESLMGLMLLLTVYCAIRARDGAHRGAWQAAAVAACVVGTGSKQTAALAPLLVLLYDYIFTEPGTKWSRPLFYLALLVPAWMVLLTIAGKVAGHFEPDRYLSFALAQPRVIVHYLRLTLWPDDLYVYVNTHLFDVDSIATVLAPATFLTALFAGTVWAIWRRHWLGFIGGWFFITLGPTSSFIGIADVIQEHRMYVPLAALAVLAAIAGDATVRKATSRLAPRSRTLVKTGVLLAIVLALATRTYIRNWDYHREFAMIHMADLHEDYRILADHYLSRPQLIRAEAERAEETLKSASDPRDIAFAHFIRGLAYEQRGELENAIRELREVLHLQPNFAYAHHRLGVALRRRGDLDGAIAQLREAIRLEPGFVYAYKELALALKENGDVDAAARLLDEALRREPRFGEAHYELGILDVERGNLERAVADFNQALRDRPDLAEAHYELGMIALKQRDPERARRHFEAAVGLQPDFTEAHFELGIRWRDQGELARAAEHLGEAVRLEPDSADFHTELGWVQLKRGNTNAARAHFQRALSLDPQYTDAKEGLDEVQRSSQSGTD